MEFSVDRSTFEKHIYAAQNVAESKGAIQILGYVLLAAEDNRLTIKATDLDLAITISCAADVSVPGKILLNARTLFETVKKGINSTIRIETNAQHHCHIDTGTKYELVGLEASEFPELPDTKVSDVVAVDKETFADAVRRTLYAASDSEARAALNGLFMQARPDGLRLVATDGHRLTYTHVPTEKPLATKAGDILAREGLSDLVRSIPADETEIKMGIYDRYAYFEWTDVVCTLRLVNADFPAYEQVVPKQSNLPKAVIMDRQVFLDSIGRVATVSNDRFNSLKLIFTKGQLTLSCNNFEQGESSDTLAVEFKDEKTEIGFNIKYVQQAVANMKSDEIKISFRDHLSAATIEDPKDGSSLAVIMPLRI